MILELRVDEQKPKRGKTSGGVQWTYSPEDVYIVGVWFGHNVGNPVGMEHLRFWDAEDEALPRGMPQATVVYFTFSTFHLALYTHFTFYNLHLKVHGPILYFTVEAPLFTLCILHSTNYILRFTFHVFYIPHIRRDASHSTFRAPRFVFHAPTLLRIFMRHAVDAGRVCNLHVTFFMSIYMFMYTVHIAFYMSRSDAHVYSILVAAAAAGCVCDAY